MLDYSESPPPLHHSPGTSDKDRSSTRDSTPVSTPVGFSPSIARRFAKDKELLWPWPKKSSESSLHLDSTLLEPDFDEPLFPPFEDNTSDKGMAGAAAPINIATRQASSSPRGHQPSNLTTALQGGGFPPAVQDADMPDEDIPRRPSSVGNSLSQWGEGTKPISFGGHGMGDRARRESVAASLTNGMSWGGISVGSWIRDDIMMSGTSPFTFQSPSNNQSSSYLPKLEANFMRDFSCCGLTLPSLHDLLQHYEESHATQPTQQPRPSQVPTTSVPDSRAAIATTTAAAVQQQGQQTAPSQASSTAKQSTGKTKPGESTGLQAKIATPKPSQLQTIPDMDTVEDMEMDDLEEEEASSMATSNLYPSAQNQQTPQGPFPQSNHPRLAPLNINLLPNYQSFRTSTPTTPTTAGRSAIPLQNNPTVSSVNTPTLMTNPAQQHLQSQFRTPDSSAPGTPVELDENLLSSLDGMSMQGNFMSQFQNGGLPPFPVNSDMIDLCIDEPAKRLFSPTGGPGNAKHQGHSRLGSGQYGPDSDIAKRIREQQMLAGVPDTSAGMMPNDEPKPYRCPVIGCEKAYKNQNGLKYHKSHGHNNQRLHDNADGTFSIVNPETQSPYPGALGMEKEKPYKCETCGKRYKNLNGLKYHKSHSPPCNPELKPGARTSGPAGLMMQNVNLNMPGGDLPTESDIA